jgi:predicted RNA-binding protein YlqC (UPF0109 family)
MTDTEQTESLLRDLVSRFVEKPDALRIAKQEAQDGSCYFVLAGDPDDGGRLAGKEGSHVDALALIVFAFGKANGRAYTFRLVNGPRPEFRAKLEPRAAVEYDAEPARELLGRVLAAMDLGEFAVDVGPGAGSRHALTFVFTVRVKDVRDQLALTNPIDPNSPDTLVGALGTLFRAIAKKDGVRMNLVVEKV